MKSRVLIFSWCVICLSHSRGIRAGLLVGTLYNPIVEITSDANTAGQLALTHEVKDSALKGALGASIQHLVPVAESTLGFATGTIRAVPSAVEDIVTGALEGASVEGNLVSGLLSGAVAGTETGFLEIVAEAIANGLSGNLIKSNDADNEDSDEIYELVYSALSEALALENPNEELYKNVISLLEHALALVISVSENVNNIGIGGVRGFLNGVDIGLEQGDLLDALTEGVRGATGGLAEEFLESFPNALKKTLIS